MDKHALTEKRESKISRQLNENNIEMHYHPIHRHRYWAIIQCKTPTVRAVLSSLARTERIFTLLPLNTYRAEPQKVYFI